MSDDVQARLDRAITEARERVLCAPDVYEVLRPAVDRMSALVAVRARLGEHMTHCNSCDNGGLSCEWRSELTAEAERLLGEDA